jgi:hypothetical protein
VDVYVDRIKATGVYVVDVPSLHAWGVRMGALCADELDAAVQVLFALGEPTDDDDIVLCTVD